MEARARIVVIGLTITSSWGNGHATTYRSLVRGLARRGHQVLFLECDKPWYAAHRDLAAPSFCKVALYQDCAELMARWRGAISSADFVIVGSYVPDGIAVGAFVNRVARGRTAFYDIDTPITLSMLEAGKCDYISAELISKFSLYLSFTGGDTLDELERRWGARIARPLYCAVDTEIYQPLPRLPHSWDLGYLGTFSADRQPTLDRLLFNTAQSWAAGRFVVAGSMYPPDLQFPSNVARIEHLPPSGHRDFYVAQRFTLSVTRADMVRRGWSPSVRLFEAASCATPIISDPWPGLDAFFRPGEEIVIANSQNEVLDAIAGMSDERRLAIGAAARARVLAGHTSDHRAAELEQYMTEAMEFSRQQASA